MGAFGTWQDYTPPKYTPPQPRDYSASLETRAPEGWTTSAKLGTPPLRDLSAYESGGFVAGRRQGISALAERLTLNSLVIAMVLALLAIPIFFGLEHLGVIGARATPPPPAATRAPTAVVPAGMTGYLGSGYSIAYPASWTHSAADQQSSLGQVHVDSFAQDDGTFAGVLTLPSLPSDYLQLGIDNLGHVVVSGGVPQALRAGLRVTYQGVLWLEDDFTVSLLVAGKQVSEEMRVLGANYGISTFVIVAVAPQASFAAVNTATFEPMLESFRLG
jgi:hypothetical protein